MQNKKGFTLIEIILVILLLSMLTVSALGSYINMNSTFNFLAAYKYTVSQVRTARSFSLADNQYNGTNVPRYGIQIKSTDGPPTDGEEFSIFLDMPAGKVIPSANVIVPGLTNKTFVGTDYKIYVYYKADLLTLPITLYFDAKTGNVSVYDKDNNFISPDAQPYLLFKIVDTKKSSERYFSIIITTGVIDEYTNNPLL